jgi:hypothetical protein
MTGDFLLSSPCECLVFFFTQTLRHSSTQALLAPVHFQGQMDFTQAGKLKLAQRSFALSQSGDRILI